MMATMKVGLDEWAIVRKADKNTVDLITDGLSGCVALIMFTAEYACLAHIYSGCDDNTWRFYKMELNYLSKLMTQYGGVVEDIIAVWSAGTPYQNLPQRIVNWGDQKCANGIGEDMGSGVRVFYEGRWQYSKKGIRNTSIFCAGYTNTAEGRNLVPMTGKLSMEAKSAELR